MSAALRLVPAEIEQIERLKQARARMLPRPTLAHKPVIDLPLVSPALGLKSIAGRTEIQRVFRCLRLISKLYRVPKEEVKCGRCRAHGPAAKARFAYTWMLWRITTWSLAKIARHQKKDHTTTLHTLRRLSRQRPHRKAYTDIRKPIGFADLRWRPEEISTLKTMFAEGKSDAEIAEAVGRPLGGIEFVRKRNGLHRKRVQIRRPSKWTDEHRAAMVALYHQHLTQTQIGKRFNTSRHVVFNILQEEMKAGRCQRRSTVARSVPVWVPEDLRDEYRRICREEDETAAAAWARREKAL